jgi:transcriptional regulatory protein LevR
LEVKKLLTRGVPIRILSLLKQQTKQENIMSNFKTVALEFISETGKTICSTITMYKTQAGLDQFAKDFISSLNLESEDNIQVNVYDPEYSLEVCVNKFYV